MGNNTMQQAFLLIIFMSTLTSAADNCWDGNSMYRSSVSTPQCLNCKRMARNWLIRNDPIFTKLSRNDLNSNSCRNTKPTQQPWCFIDISTTFGWEQIQKVPCDGEGRDPPTMPEFNTHPEINTLVYKARR